MLDSDSGVLRSVAWSEVCPWLRIFRTFRLAISFRVLLLAAVAVFLTVGGWGLIGWAFSGDPPNSEADQWLAAYQECPWLIITDTEIVPNRPSLPSMTNLAEPGRPSAATIPTHDPFFGSWAMLSRPLWGVFDTSLTITGLARLVLSGLWAVAVWAFFGGAITRIAAVQLASDEHVGWGAAIRYAGSKWLSYFFAPLFPLMGILLAAVPVCLLGLLLRANVGVLLVALVWPLLLIAGLLMAMLLLGLIFGWPLMLTTISAEGTDSFDALSRSYAYVFQRPLHYLFYAVVAGLLGTLGWVFVSNFAAAVVGLSYSAAGWGAGWEGDVPRIELIIDRDKNETESTDESPPIATDNVSEVKPETPGGDALGTIGGAGAMLIRFWAGCVKLLAVGFLFGYFWTASTAIYFLLRRDVDATEMDEVFLDEDESEQTYGLPPITTDEAGTPVVSDNIPEVEPDNAGEGDAGEGDAGEGDAGEGDAGEGDGDDDAT